MCALQLHISATYSMLHQRLLQSAASTASTRRLQVPCRALSPAHLALRSGLDALLVRWEAAGLPPAPGGPADSSEIALEAWDSCSWASSFQAPAAPGWLRLADARWDALPLALQVLSPPGCAAVRRRLLRLCAMLQQLLLHCQTLRTPLNAP